MTHCALRVLAAVCVGGCAVETLPPPPPPPQVMPMLESPLPEASPGRARVIIATDVDARVDHRGPEAAPPAGSLSADRRFCAKTPCVVVLPYGDHEFAFKGIKKSDRTSSVRLAIRNDPVVVSHTLGIDRTSPDVLRGLVIIFGGVCLIATAAGGPTNIDTTSEVQTARLIIGSIGIAVGGLLIAASTTTVRDGATTQWTPAPSATPTSPKPSPALSLQGQF